MHSQHPRRGLLTGCPHPVLAAAVVILPVNAQWNCPATCAARGHTAITGSVNGQALCRKKLPTGQTYLGALRARAGALGQPQGGAQEQARGRLHGAGNAAAASHLPPAGTWSQAVGRCDYAISQGVFQRTAPGEAFDCVCYMASIRLEWASALGCMAGGGAAIREAAPPACRVIDPVAGVYRM